MTWTVIRGEVASAATERGRRSVSAAPVGATEALVVLYRAHYQELVRLAWLLLRDHESAEEVVQDAFVAMHDSWQRLRQPDKAVAYLRQTVVNRCRSALRHRTVVDRFTPPVLPDAPSAEQGALGLLARESLMQALATLPLRQREALVLRYYADLTEAQIADAMGISPGAVKSHASRGLHALRELFGDAADSPLEGRS
jgi:RNA polymerase sigma-70 factor (sigma-E family)